MITDNKKTLLTNPSLCILIHVYIYIFMNDLCVLIVLNRILKKLSQKYNKCCSYNSDTWYPWRTQYFFQMIFYQIYILTFKLLHVNTSIYFHINDLCFNSFEQNFTFKFSQNSINVLLK